MPNVELARILIVDDEAAHMTALCRTLKSEGYSTTGVVSAKEALAALHEQEFDLVLTDLMMPEMDGIDLIHAALETDPNLVGIIMTGQGTISTAVEAMKTGALDYILKPFKLSVILPVLARALAVRHLRIENAALQKHLRERTDELEAANKELDAFASSVAHDLHAPVRHIEGYAHFLENESGASLSDRSRQHLATIISSAQRLASLIANLLHFSRLARAALQVETVDLNQIVAETLLRLEPETKGRNIRWTIADLPNARGDNSLLHQVLYNLLSNAIKYTSRRAAAEIEVGCRPDGASEQIFFVRDNGAGFNMEYVEKLFGVFQRLHREEEFEGTGVGLANVRRIIARHGGRTWAEGEVDKGATFYFTLTAIGKE